MRMRVILVRHGQTDWNDEDIFRGQLDVGLNRTGERQADLIGRRLKRVPLNAVYASPLSRARNTAARIARSHRKKVCIADTFTDFHFGEWQGKSRTEVQNMYPEIYREWESSPHTVEIPGGEKLSQVFQRVALGLNELLIMHRDETVLLVSHGLTNKVMLSIVLGIESSGFWKIKQDNGALNVFLYTLRGSKLFLMNDTSHLASINHLIRGMKEMRNPPG
jgi:broad specificity phosphatase PhoE